MKTKFLSILITLVFTGVLNAQQWMKSLDIAQRLALVQNKMVLMVWEDTTQAPYPIFVNDKTGRKIFINNLFDSEIANELIWEHFVPVIVSETRYADLYDAIKENRSMAYIEKFNDDSIKIMDVNGTIINRSNGTDYLENLTKIIRLYALETSFMSTELRNYKNQKTFYSAFYLASKYLDFSIYHNEPQRSSIIKLFDIYLKETSHLLSTVDTKDKLQLQQRLNLLKLQKLLITNRPKKILRQLDKMKAATIQNNNTQFVAFLYYTAYKLLKNENKAKLWASQISSVNLRKSHMIIRTRLNEF